MQYKVLKIEEDMDFGCEERQPGEALMSVVLMEDENRNETSLRHDDGLLYERDINVFYNTVAVIESKTSAIPKEQMTDIAKTILEPMWQWHEVFAYIMIFAFVARIIYMLAGGIRFPNPFKSNQPLKERLQGFTYVYFYLFRL